MNDKKSVLRSSFLINFAIGLLIFFAFTIGLTTKVYIGGGIELYGTFLLALLILALNSPYVKHLSILSKNQALVLILIAWVLINNAELGRGIYERLMFTLFFFLVYLFISEYNEWTGFCLNSIKVLGIVYAMLTVFFALNTGLYVNIVMPVFADYTSMYQQNYAFLNGYLCGFTPNAAINAIYILAALGVCFSNVIVSNRRKVTSWILPFFLLGILFMTGKRGHLIFCLIALVLVYFINSSEDIINKYSKFVLITFGLVIVFIIAVQYIPALANVFTKFENQTEMGRIDSGRFDIWNYAFGSFLKSPLWGHGWDSFKYLFEPVYGYQINVHNVYIQLLTDVGLLGAIPFYCFFIMSFKHVKKAFKFYKNSTDLKAKRDICFALYIQVFFLLYCLTGNPLYDATPLFLYIISCAIGEYYYSTRNKT